MTKRKPCPKCKRVKLDETSMRALIGPLQLFARGKLPLTKLQDCINDAAVGHDDHAKTALTIGDRALRLLQTTDGLSTVEISESLKCSAGAAYTALFRLQSSGRVRSVHGRPTTWWRKK